MVGLVNTLMVMYTAYIAIINEDRCYVYNFIVLVGIKRHYDY